ncbi:hypothetical protein [Novosphingobium gossypii]|uniref:hypothetical protein n=1 Tax=Novosphingobium gossypii TaxID=1604774 RepID=UPI003D1C1404
MPEPLPTAQSKIVDAFAALLRAFPDLSGTPVYTERDPDDGLDADTELACIVISVENWTFQNDYSQGQSRHRMVVNFDYLETSARAGQVSRAAMEKVAFILAAIGTDPTLGGRLEDFDERDVAPPMDNGKSIGGSSLQGVCAFYTPRRDHFTIIGVGGDLL